MTCFFLYFLWNRKKENLGTGLLSGLFFIFVFGFRFLIEFIKLPQTEWEANWLFDMGQWLSLPFVLLGSFLFFRWYRSKGNRVKTLEAQP